MYYSPLTSRSHRHFLLVSPPDAHAFQSGFDLICEADFFEALGEARYTDIRMRHTVLFEALDEEGTRSSVLAEPLGMTHHAMAQLLDDTEAAGYITRIPDATDRRARVVKLFEQGQTAVELC